MDSAAIPVDIVFTFVEIFVTFSGIIWAVVQPTREAKIENLTNMVGLLRIKGIILREAIKKEKSQSNGHFPCGWGGGGGRLNPIP